MSLTVMHVHLVEQHEEGLLLKSIMNHNCFVSLVSVIEVYFYNPHIA